MMSGVANGYLPRLQLIKQIQDGNANVIYAPKPPGGPAPPAGL